VGAKSSREYECVIELDDEFVRQDYGDHQLVFKWSFIREVRELASSVILLTETSQCCFIPNRFFNGTSEREAFVEACVEKIKGHLE